MVFSFFMWVSSRSKIVWTEVFDNKWGCVGLFWSDGLQLKSWALWALSSFTSSTDCHLTCNLLGFESGERTSIFHCSVPRCWWLTSTCPFRWAGNVYVAVFYIVCLVSIITVISTLSIHPLHRHKLINWVTIVTHSTQLKINDTDLSMNLNTGVDRNECTF